MGTSHKVAFAVDLDDWGLIANIVDEIAENPMITDRKTPDNTYRCVYWDDIYWGMYASHIELERVLADKRHAFIAISEEGNIQTEVVEEEFSELLSWTADICFWDAGAPLSPVYPFSQRFDHYMPISRNRVIQILSSYIDNDLQATETDYVYEALTQAGATDAEITALGFGFVIPEE